MKNLTRRTFIQGATALAAGAAVGIPAYKIREHGPVDIRLFFFTKDPLVIKGDLLADERQDLFRIRAYDKTKVAVTAEMKLSDVKQIVAMPRKKIRLEMTLTGNDRIQKSSEFSGVSKDGTLTFLFDEKPGQDPSPVWLMLDDVKRVL